MKNKEFLFKLAITAIFTALCYGLTFVSIPLPTGAKVHLGNFVCVLAGMLCGGVIGGITGSIGMGLNDITCGYEWSTFVRTFIVKFILGFTVGLLFRILVKRDKAAKITLYTLTSVFTLGFIGTLVLYATGAQALNKDGSANIGTRTHSFVIGETTKTISTSVLVPIFMGVIALVLAGVIVFLFISKKQNKEVNIIHNIVATVTTISVIINTLLEFFLRWFLKGILVGSDAALAESITKIPSNLITGVVTIVAVTIVYLPIYYALKHAGYEKYLIPNNVTEQVTDADLSETDTETE